MYYLVLNIVNDSNSDFLINNFKLIKPSFFHNLLHKIVKKINKQLA